VLSAEVDTQLVADFVRRLRRVALHPLALDASGDDSYPGGLLRSLAQVSVGIEEHEDGTFTMRVPLPDEVQLESLATRLRPFTLARDRLYWQKAFAALDRLTGGTDPVVTASTNGLRDEWTRATDRTRRARAFFTGYAPVDGTGGTHHFTDIELAFAWLYQDVAHGDAVTTGHFDVTDRFRAAVNVFSNMAVVALETLEYVNELVELEVITLPVGTFADTVIVTSREHVLHGAAYIETEVGDDLSDPAIEESLPAHLRPAMAMVREMVQQRSGDPESEVVAVQIQRAVRES